MLEFRAECRAYAQEWMDIQAGEFRASASRATGPTATPRWISPSEAAIAGEIGKFLMNGALYRGLRPVMWSRGREDRAGRGRGRVPRPHQHTIWVRFPVRAAAAEDLRGASVVIWTTTPWTMPGNRAIAYGAEIDYALVHVDSVEPNGRRRGAASACWWRSICCRRSAPMAGIATHHVLRVRQGRGLAGIVCAHPLRGQGYDFDVPLLLGDFVTTEAGTGFVHIAPGHGEDDFALGRAHGIEVPETVGRRRHVLSVGAAVRRRACVSRPPIRSCAALLEARRAGGARQAGAFLSAFLALARRR